MARCWLFTMSSDAYDASYQQLSLGDIVHTLSPSPAPRVSIPTTEPNLDAPLVTAEEALQPHSSDKDIEMFAPPTDDISHPEQLALVSSPRFAVIPSLASDSVNPDAIIMDSFKHDMEVDSDILLDSDIESIRGRLREFGMLASNSSSAPTRPLASHTPLEQELCSMVRSLLSNLLSLTLHNHE